MENKFVTDAGGCIVSKNILSGKGKVKWCFREAAVNENDNGWRFLSDIDTEEYINDVNNMSVCDFNTVASIEPAILAIWGHPVGTDVELVYIGLKKRFIDCASGREL